MIVELLEYNSLQHRRIRDLQWSGFTWWGPGRRYMGDGSPQWSSGPKPQKGVPRSWSKVSN